MCRIDEGRGSRKFRSPTPFRFWAMLGNVEGGAVSAPSPPSGARVNQLFIPNTCTTIHLFPGSYVLTLLRFRISPQAGSLKDRNTISLWCFYCPPVANKLNLATANRPQTTALCRHQSVNPQSRQPATNIRKEQQTGPRQSGKSATKTNQTSHSIVVEAEELLSETTHEIPSLKMATTPIENVPRLRGTEFKARYY